MLGDTDNMDTHMHAQLQEVFNNPVSVKSKRDISLEMAVVSVAKNGLMLGYIDRKIINYELCVLAVTNEPLSIVYVPDEYKTEQLCAIAYNGNKDATTFMPNAFKTYFEGLVE